jgi:TP901 family phage tail tape measure protein
MRKKMEEQANFLSTKLPIAANKAAEAYFFLASAGLNAEQSLAALPIVARFATAGMFDMATATDLLTDAQSALGLTVKDTGQNMKNMLLLSDMFVKANTLSNTSVKQFSEALTAGAGAAIKAYNIDLKDAFAVLNAYADAGKKGAEGGNLFQRMVNLTTNAWMKNKAIFKQYGIEVFNAQGELSSFVNIIGDMDRAFKGVSTEMKGVMIKQLGFEALAKKSILPLLGMSEKIREYRKFQKASEDVQVKKQYGPADATAAGGAGELDL